MPSGATAVLIAAGGLLVVIMLQLPGWQWLWGRLSARTRIGLVLVLVSGHVPFVYWLLLYKPLPLAWSAELWRALWMWGLSVVATGIVLSAGRAVSWLRKRRAGIEPQPERRHFLRIALVGGVSLAVSGQLLAATQRRRGHVEFVELPLSGLPPQFDGLTLGVVSDIHSGPFMQRPQMERYRRELEELGCDLIVLPGDFIINRTQEIYPFVEAFAGLSAPCGVFAITGNHDYFSGEVERICREIEQAGIRLLRNEAIVLERDGAAVTLAGIDDFYARFLPAYVEHGDNPDGVLSAWERLMERMPRPRIVLCHRPYYFEELALLGAEAVIAGHTHGGQIVLAEIGSFALSPAALVSPYVAGTYWSARRRGTWMYVTRGIGTVGIPLRWNAPPEITHIRLVAAGRG